MEYTKFHHGQTFELIFENVELLHEELRFFVCLATQIFKDQLFCEGKLISFERGLEMVLKFKLIGSYHHLVNYKIQHLDPFCLICWHGFKRVHQNVTLVKKMMASFYFLIR